jgi:tetratricopeptide (TPR) repeat protein
LRAEADQIRARIAQLAPDHWSVKRERAYSLWREGKRAEAVAAAKEIMDSGPPTYDHLVPYANLNFAAGHLNEAVAVDEQIRAIEPLAMFHSRSLQFDYIAARRYDEAEAEYRRSLALEGSHVDPAWVAFLRTLARKDADPKALRELHGQLVQDFGDRAPPNFRDLGAVLHDRDAMLAILRKAAADHGDSELWLLADALGDADLAAAALRDAYEVTPGFKEGHMPFGDYFALWLAPYSGLRAHPDFKKLLIETGLAEYWRQAGKWGDVCKPVGADDFQCQ